MTFPVLQDKVAIVTGAAMGMGVATARLFAAAGAKVLVADLNAEGGRTPSATSSRRVVPPPSARSTSPTRRRCGRWWLPRSRRTVASTSL